MKIAIIIPVYNNLEFTRTALADLKQAISAILHVQITIVVVDDGSNDGTGEWIKLHYPEVVVLYGDGNLWWSGSINLGARYAVENISAEYIVLWNNDIAFAKDYFSELVKILNENDHTTIIGSKIFVAENTTLIWSMGGYFNPQNGKFGMKGYFEKDSGNYNNIVEADWLTGMGTVVHRSILQTIGYWDNINFPQYYGDSDFTYRLKLKKHMLKVYPSLKLYNHVRNSGLNHNGTLKGLLHLFTNIKSKQNLKTNLIFYRKYATSPFAYIPLIHSYSRLILGFFKWMVLGHLGIEKRSKL